MGVNTIFPQHEVDIVGTVRATSFDGDGSGLTGIESLPSQTSQSGKFLTTDGSAASWGTPGGGKVLQVIHKYQAQSGSYYTNSTSYVDTQLSATITLSSTSSKVLVLMDIHGINVTYANGYLRIVRGSTEFAGSVDFYASNDAHNFGQSIMTIDSPSSTSALTYTVQAKTNNTSRYYSYHESGANNLILMEIGV
jgi:hypothetical protein